MTIFATTKYIPDGLYDGKQGWIPSVFAGHNEIKFAEVEDFLNYGGVLFPIEPDLIQEFNSCGEGFTFRELEYKTRYTEGADIFNWSTEARTKIRSLIAEFG